MATPTLILVTGPAGSGKTELAHALAPAIGCPAICRDEIKEGMVHAQAGAFQAAVGDELTMRTFPLFFDVIRVLMQRGATVVAEAACQDHVWRKGLDPLLRLASLRIILCTVPYALARQRVLRRRGEPARAAHADAEWLDAPAADFAWLSLRAPSLVVDTTDGYVPDLASVIRFARFVSCAIDQLGLFVLY